MVKTLYLVRHGQGFHNVSESQPHGNSFVKDPLLTPVGKMQCAGLRKLFAEFHDNIDLVLASPLRRTVQTAVLGLGPTIQRDVPILLVPKAQEISDKPCDTGTDPTGLKISLDEIFGEQVEYGFDSSRIDYSLVEEGWNSKKGEYEASLEATKKRADALRCWLWSRPEENIALVTVRTPPSVYSPMACFGSFECLTPSETFKRALSQDSQR
ncbi:putative phosphatase SPAC5H10.03 [Lachnellula suecica]|uniref:Putative phosphatase SPAC5H10.03 n=1 Tax=Lachnellula suecica TaxID=602035 RepID=A0A8T9CKT4_9HELO|nr:putative phosphatase SPAC5H10.03 [Lachnellula suecica]